LARAAPIAVLTFEGHEDDEVVQEAMLGILKQSSFLQVLGSYPMAKMPTP
jgi:prephenate dehydratase